MKDLLCLSSKMMSLIWTRCGNMSSNQPAVGCGTPSTSHLKLPLVAHKGLATALSPHPLRCLVSVRCSRWSQSRSHGVGVSSPPIRHVSHLQRWNKERLVRQPQTWSSNVTNEGPSVTTTGLSRQLRCFLVTTRQGLGNPRSTAREPRGSPGPRESRGRVQGPPCPQKLCANCPMVPVSHGAKLGC